MTVEVIAAPRSIQGPRQRKQRETKARIAEAALALFVADGYEKTTLDMIAKQAGISRRTFFSYFKSKDELIMAWQAGGWEAIRKELLSVSPDQQPLTALHRIVAAYAVGYPVAQMVLIDQVVHASENLMALKQAAYVTEEQALYATMCEVWRQPQRQAELRVAAMLAVGAIRLSLEAWSGHDGRLSMLDLLNATFAQLAMTLSDSKSSPV